MAGLVNTQLRNVNGTLGCFTDADCGEERCVPLSVVWVNGSSIRVSPPFTGFCYCFTGLGFDLDPVTGLCDKWTPAAGIDVAILALGTLGFFYAFIVGMRIFSSLLRTALFPFLESPTETNIISIWPLGRCLRLTKGNERGSSGNDIDRESNSSIFSCLWRSWGSKAPTPIPAAAAAAAAIMSSDFEEEEFDDNVDDITGTGLYFRREGKQTVAAEQIRVPTPVPTLTAPAAPVPSPGERAGAMSIDFEEKTPHPLTPSSSPSVAAENRKNSRDMVSRSKSPQPKGDSNDASSGGSRGASTHPSRLFRHTSSRVVAPEGENAVVVISTNIGAGAAIKQPNNELPATPILIPHKTNAAGTALLEQGLAVQTVYESKNNAPGELEKIPNTNHGNNRKSRERMVTFLVTVISATLASMFGMAWGSITIAINANPLTAEHSYLTSYIDFVLTFSAAFSYLGAFSVCQMWLQVAKAMVKGKRIGAGMSFTSTRHYFRVLIVIEMAFVAVMMVLSVRQDWDGYAIYMAPFLFILSTIFVAAFNRARHSLEQIMAVRSRAISREGDVNSEDRFRFESMSLSAGRTLSSRGFKNMWCCDTFVFLFFRPRKDIFAPSVTSAATASATRPVAATTAISSHMTASNAPMLVLPHSVKGQDWAVMALRDIIFTSLVVLFAIIWVMVAIIIFTVSTNDPVKDDPAMVWRPIAHSQAAVTIGAAILNVAVLNYVFVSMQDSKERKKLKRESAVREASIAQRRMMASFMRELFENKKKEQESVEERIAGILIATAASRNEATGGQASTGGQHRSPKQTTKDDDELY